MKATDGLVMNETTDMARRGGSTAGIRATAAAVLVGALSFIGLAAWLEPAGESGLGTHTQLGLPECEWLISKDMPCPTCGMTTAVSLAADGRIGLAAATQPAGAALALGAAMAAWMSLHTLVTGNAAAWRMVRRHLNWRLSLGGAALLIGLGWAWRLALAASA